MHKHISEVRLALEDNPGRPHCVRNVRGKGYLFRLTVRQADASGPAAHTPRDGGADGTGIQDFLASLEESIPERISRLQKEAIRLIETKGISAPEVKDRLEHAMTLSGEADRPRFFIALQGFCIYLIMRDNCMPPMESPACCCNWRSLRLLPYIRSTRTAPSVLSYVLWESIKRL